MADGVYRVAVVTPEERLVDAPARSIVVRSSAGFFTVLDGHAPVVTDVVPGEVRIEPEDGDVVRLAVHGGFLQVETASGLDEPETAERSTRVTLLAGVAELAEQIDVVRAERARGEAQARVEQLRAATGRTGPGPGGAGGSAAGTGTGIASESDEVPRTPEELELAQAEAALRRAEVRLEVAGAAN